jgi:transposase InsO family protein
MDKIQIPKLKGRTNWTIWKLQVESNLQYHDFEGIINGQIDEPAPIAADATNQQKKDYEASVKLFKKANGYAVTLLTTTVEDEPLQLILMFRKAREMWEKLSVSYEQKSEQRLEHLYLQLLEYRKETTDSIATHVSKLQKLWIELNEESQRIDGCKLPQTLLLMRILSTLPEEYFDFRTTWESVQREQRTVEYLLERLTMIEIRIAKREDDTRSQVATSALVVQDDFKHLQKKKFVAKYNSKPKKYYYKVQCYACKQFGHTQVKCPSRSSATFVKTVATGNSAALFGRALLAKPTCAEVWIADTGATHHMTKNRSFFSSYAAFDKPKPVVTGNQDVMFAYGSGEIQVTSDVDGVKSKHRLTDVWYTPDVIENLFSVPAAAAKGCEYWLTEERCELLLNGRVILTGHRDQGLYCLNIQVLAPDVQAVACITHSTETLQIWHEKLAHQSKQHVESFLKEKNIKYVNDNVLCESCIKGKQHRLSFGTRNVTAEKPGDLVHADLCGPMEEDSFSGYRYFLCFKDDFTKYRSIYFLKTKSEAVDKLKVFLAEARTQGHTVKELRTDGGGEFDNVQFRSVTQQSGILHRMTMPFTPEQNGTAERENRTLVEAARTMLQSTSLTKKLWAEAVNTATYVLNHTAVTRVSGKAPYELWLNRTISFDHLRVFGTHCYVHIPKQKRKKFDAKGTKGCFVGYCGERDGYRIYIPEQHKVVLSRDVIFVGEAATTSVQSSDSCSQGQRTTVSQDSELAVIDFASDDDDQNVVGAEVGPQRVLRDRSQLTMPARYEDYAFLMCEPRSYDEAMQSDNQNKWTKAMEEEMKSLTGNDTWELVDKPTNKNIVDNRWVYRVKTNHDGTERYKARLVAKGYSQQQGVDYGDTYSPVTRFDTIRAILSTAASERLLLQHFDVKTAFLYGELEELVYMKQPQGFEDGSDKVCKLKRSLYGLKQSPRCWNRKFTDVLNKYGLQVSDSDPCLFTSKDRKLLIALYVDDGLVAAQNQSHLSRFLEELKAHFEITVSPVSNFLGLQVTQHDNGSVFVCQEDYTKKMLAKFGMTDCNPVMTPMEKNYLTVENEEPISAGTPYREAVGSLLYLATGTRPDIAYAVNTVSQAVCAPSQKDWQAVKRIFRYLKGTSHLGITYSATHISDGLSVYSDADYAGDMKSRKSTSGVLAQYNGGAVTWSSKKQSSVALSTTESELMAACEAAKEIVWLSRLYGEITTVVLQPPSLFVDNQSAIKLIRNPVFHHRTKHIEVRHFFIREQLEEGKLSVMHVDGTNQLADILTKPLPRERFERLRDIILGVY